MAWRYVLLFIGVFACSTAAIFIKASHLPAVALAALRLLLAAAALSPLFWRDWKTHRAAYTRQHLRRTLVPAIILSAHFISWGFGARMTLSAQASLIVNLAPVALPFFLHSLTGETINRTEIFGTGLALLGIIVLSVRDVLSGGGNLWGNVVCFGSMLFFAWYLALGRRNRDFPSLWLYVVPVYLQGGVICGLVALGVNGLFFTVPPARELALVAGLAIAPTIIGHSLLNLSMRHLRGQVVSLCNVGQFVFAGVMAYFLFHESPSATFYAAAALVVAGIALVVFSAPTAPPRMR